MEYAARYATLLGYVVGKVMGLKPVYAESGAADNGDAQIMDAAIDGLYGTTKAADETFMVAVRQQITRALLAPSWQIFIGEEVMRGYPKGGPAKPFSTQPMLSRDIAHDALARAVAKQAALG